VPGVALDPKGLADVLVSSTEEVRQRCGQQLRKKAPLREWESASVEGNHLAGIYSVRADHVRRISLPVIGIEETVLSFQEHGK
jgi:hypothetical protein